jgi:hypothetical protein
MFSSLLAQAAEMSLQLAFAQVVALAEVKTMSNPASAASGENRKRNMRRK